MGFILMFMVKILELYWEVIEIYIYIIGYSFGVYVVGFVGKYYIKVRY